MARLYLTLYGVLFVTIGLFYGSLAWVLEVALHGTIQQYLERAMLGAYELVELRLVEHPPSHWDEVVAELEPHFHNGLALYTLPQLDISKAQKERLEAGQLVFQEQGEQTLLYKEVGSSGRYLMMALGSNPEQKERDNVAGIFYMVESRFLDRQQADWPALLVEMGQTFKMPLALLPLDDNELPKEEMANILTGKVAITGLEDRNNTYYKRLGKSGQILRAGPFPEPAIFHYLNPILLFVLALFVALAVYIGVRPVWRDLVRIDRGVRIFGKGDLDSRLLVRKRSALKPLADTFNGMAERMQRLITSHRELTSAVSHELRTPIARLRFRVDMLAENLSVEDRERHLNAMRKDIVELEELVSESLSYSRLDRERPELVLETVVLDDWLRDLMEEIEEELLSVEVKLETQCGEDQEVELDSRLLGRAIKNLLRNAHRHAAGKIRVSAHCENGKAGIHVEDDGPGVPEQERERIFTPFARLDAARDRESGGVGLGLAIVSQIARWHNGRAWVQDSNLGGARFVIAWPVKSEPMLK